MSKGQGLSGQLEGLTLKIIMIKFEGNPFKNNKVIATNSKISAKQAKFRHLTLKVKVIYGCRSD
jgi:hypothetical protein